MTGPIPRPERTLTPGKDFTLHFTVEDTGSGISEDRIDAIFDAFTQEDSSITRKFGGTGLGLSIVNQLTTLMGGTIKVESSVGVGTKFDVYLPFDEASAEDFEKFAQNDRVREHAEFGCLNILLAEDNDVNAMIATAFLKNLGHSVRHVENGRDAVRVVCEKWADMILMDVHMPEMDGIEATKVIRETKSRDDLPIIGLTAEAFVERHNEFVKDGMDFVLTKPFTEGQLGATIARYVPRSKSHSSDREIDFGKPCGRAVTMEVPESFDDRHTHQSAPIGDDSKLAELSKKLDSETLSSLLVTSEECLEARVVKLRAGVDGSDTDIIFEAAHSMKGASGSMFGLRMSALAAVVEENSADLEMTRHLLPEIEKTADETIDWWRSKRAIQ